MHPVLREWSQRDNDKRHVVYINMIKNEFFTMAPCDFILSWLVNDEERTLCNLYWWCFFLLPYCNPMLISISKSKIVDTIMTWGEFSVKSLSMIQFSVFSYSIWFLCNNYDYDDNNMMMIKKKSYATLVTQHAQVESWSVWGLWFNHWVDSEAQHHI